MANLSNINGKFLFTDGDFLLIGGATANSISATESGVAIKNSNAATLSLQNSATNGKNHTLLSNTDGSFNITDVGVATRFTITSGGDVYFPETLRLGIGTTSIYPQGGDTILKLYSASGGSSLYLQSANTGSATTDGSKIYIGTTDLTISNMEGETRFFNEGSIMMNISKFDGSANANPLTSSNIRIWTHSKTGWLPGDILSKIEFYSNDVSGIGARNAASIRVVNEDGDGSTTTTFSGALAFYTSAYNSTEQEAMRIDSSGNVGIGDDSPTSKLTILGTSTAASNTPSDAIVDIHGTSTAHLLMGVANVSPFGAWINTDATGQPLVLQGTGGDVGIGTDSPDNSLHILYDDSTVYSDSTHNAGIQIENENTTTNTFSQLHFRSGNSDSYIRSIREGDNLASLAFLTDNGGATGDVGEAMRINSSGNVGIGTDEPDAKLEITTLRENGIRLSSSDSTAFPDELLSGIEFYSPDTSGGAGVKASIQVKYNDGDANSYMTFSTGTNTERMRIDSSGTVTVTNSSSAVLKLQAGTNSSASLRLINDAHDWDVNCQTNDRFAIYSHTDATERLVILPTSGNVGIGTTSPGYTFTVSKSITNDWLALFGNTYNGAGNGVLIDAGNGSSGEILRLRDKDGNNKVSFLSTGRIKAPNLGGFTPTGADLRYDTSDGEIYYQTSSERYKTDIVNLESSLDKINTLRPVRYNDIKTGQPACGLIAEETVDVIPEVVFKKEIEGFDEPQIEGLNYSDLIPFLIKSIQELKAEVEKLRTQINN